MAPVIVFVAGWSGEGAVDAARGQEAVRALAAELPFFAPQDVRSWRAPSGAAAAAWVGHRPAQLGGVEHVAAEADRLAMFAGRPLGRLDPRDFLGPSEEWGARLDVRAAALRFDDASRTLEVRGDALGAYPLFTTEAGGGTWVANNAEALRALRGTRTADLDALAGLLGGGWPLGGAPVWAGVERLPRGRLLRLAGAARQKYELLPDEHVAAMCGNGHDPDWAADALVELVRALADWPGRPSLVPVTGGRDSRLVLAAALRAGIPFRAVTGGAPDSSDVVAARRVCRVAGIEHELLPADPHGDPYSTPREAARVLGLTAAGTASLADAMGFPLGPAPGVLPLWHSGQGGEVARAYYRSAAAGDRDELVAGLERAFCGRRPGRAEPLSGDGRERVRRGLSAFVDAQLAAGARPRDVPDLFYLHERMGSWAGPTHGCAEYARDVTSPLWSVRLLPHELGAPALEREREAFHAALLRRLAPELADVSYAGASKGGLRHKARRAVEEVRRRVAPPEGGSDPFSGVLADVRAAVAAQPDHVAWRVLDRGRVDALLARDAVGLDEMSRHYVWRIATVFLDPGLAEAEQP